MNLKNSHNSRKKKRGKTPKNDDGFKRIFCTQNKTQKNIFKRVFSGNKHGKNTEQKRETNKVTKTRKFVGLFPGFRQRKTRK